LESVGKVFFSNISRQDAKTQRKKDIVIPYTIKNYEFFFFSAIFAPSRLCVNLFSGVFLQTLAPLPQTFGLAFGFGRTVQKAWEYLKAN